jgi:hypothetical protein
MAGKQLLKNGGKTAAEKMAGKQLLLRNGGKNTQWLLLLLAQLIAGAPGRPSSKRVTAVSSDSLTFLDLGPSTLHLVC